MTSAYTRKTHPNYIQSLGNGDMDSLIELVGHIRAENPGSEVRWLGRRHQRLRSADCTR